MLAARRILNASLLLPFYMTMRDFSDMPRHLSKHTIVAHTKLALPTIFRGWQNSSNCATTASLVEDNSRAPSTETKIFVFNDTIATVHYKVPLDRAKQIK